MACFHSGNSENAEGFRGANRRLLAVRRVT